MTLLCIVLGGGLANWTARRVSSLNVDCAAVTPACWPRLSVFLRSIQGGQQDEVTHLLLQADRFPRTHSSLYR